MAAISAPFFLGVVVAAGVAAVLERGWCVLPQGLGGWVDVGFLGLGSRVAKAFSRKCSEEEVCGAPRCVPRLIFEQHGVR
jgi:hypothetical protein